ncbi:hypothetical protein E1H99_07655 [Enterococcus hirae]|nr:hypothetical protein E1H99_07655 [Enterococcus hirae]
MILYFERIRKLFAKKENPGQKSWVESSESFIYKNSEPVQPEIEKELITNKKSFKQTTLETQQIPLKDKLVEEQQSKSQTINIHEENKDKFPSIKQIKNTKLNRRNALKLGKSEKEKVINKMNQQQALTELNQSIAHGEEPIEPILSKETKQSSSSLDFKQDQVLVILSQELRGSANPSSLERKALEKTANQLSNINAGWLKGSLKIKVARALFRKNQANIKHALSKNNMNRSSFSPPSRA